MLQHQCKKQKSIHDGNQSLKKQGFPIDKMCSFIDILNLKFIIIRFLAKSQENIVYKVIK